ncbi:MAG: methionine adenosyltransferase [Thermohalobaculum sp.]|nr:methionine adenosyltransferase [Thermohalobaculum sp.]
MVRKNYLFTSESVSEGHPDKVCDQISDGIVDLILARESEARVAVETAATTNKVVLMGEIKVSPEHAVDKEEMIESARETIRRIGYMQKGFHFKTAEIDCYVHEQSPDIAQGVDASDNKDEGAGDQGIMFGYATNETPELMPAPLLYSHRILHLMAEARHADAGTLFGPDAKSQLTLEYRDGQPVRVHTVVVSSQHQERDAAGREVTSAYMRELIEPFVRRALPEGFLDADTVWHVNPTGRFVIGGPDGDAGLTGRKIIVDTYGGAAPHGGGAFSGKDPTKVDRSAAYAARYIAKNVVAAGLASKCTIQLAYAIGVAEPLALYVDGHGTEAADPVKIEAAIRETMNLTPRGIRTRLGLNRPIYQRTAAYGHFGREPQGDGGFSWEKLDLAPALKGVI